MSITQQTFAEYIDLYCEQIIEVFNHQESGVKSQSYDLRMFNQFLIDNQYKDITLNSLLEFIVYLRKKRNNSPDSANRKISTIKTYFRFLRFHSVHGASELKVDDIKSVRSPYKGPLQTLSFDDVNAIFEQIDTDSMMGYRDFAMCSLLYRLGLRIGEVHRLNMSDIDMENETITVHGKGNKKRVLPLVDDMPQVIAKAMVIRNAFYRSDKTDALFVSRKGDRLAVRTMQDNFKKLVDAAGKLSISKVTPHTMRHAFASHIMEKEGADLVVLKAMMGHKYLSTLEIYLHPSVEAQRRAVNDHIANEILGGATETMVSFSRFQPKRKYA